MVSICLPPSPDLLLCFVGGNSLLHTTTNPCYLLEQQLPLKSYTIKKNYYSVIHIYLPLTKHNNKSGKGGRQILTINNPVSRTVFTGKKKKLFYTKWSILQFNAA